MPPPSPAPPPLPGKDRPPKIVVVGSSTTDFVIECDHLPHPGETVVGGKFTQYSGGRGATQAVAASRAGAKVWLVGLHGNDKRGEDTRARLKQEGLDVTYFQSALGNVASGVTISVMGLKERQTIVAVADSANDKLHLEHLQRARSVIQEADMLICQFAIPMSVVEMCGVMAEEYNKPLLLNPAPAHPISERLVRRIDTITPGQEEALEISNKGHIEEAAEVLQSQGCRQIVITLGSRGALTLDEDGQISYIPAPKVVPVSTHGAGDCFNGWLAVELAKGKSLQEATETAIRAASLFVTRDGIQRALPTRQELKEHDFG